MLLEQRASPRENWHWTEILSPLLYPGYKEWNRGLAGHLLIGWGTYMGGGGAGRVRQISSPYAVGGETGYTAQEGLKSINSYNIGEGRKIRVWFFCSCIPRPSLVLPALSSLSHHTRDCSPSGSSVPGIFQAKILEWVSISCSRGSSWPRDGIHVSCIGRWILHHCTTWEPMGMFLASICICMLAQVLHIKINKWLTS